MLKLFRRSSAEASAVLDTLPSIGTDRRVYAIGDIHGCADLFERILALIEADEAERGVVGQSRIILLGDLVNRGPMSAAVVDLALDLAERRDVLTLAGNHEEVFALALAGDLAALRFFLRMGGRETLASYGFSEHFIENSAYEDIHAAMMADIPQAHRDFITSLPNSCLIEDYLFVHAGIRPGIPVDEQAENDLRWIREDFLSSNVRHPYVVVHGHSISERVDERSNRIGIDTGAYRSGRLTAVGLQHQERWFLSARLG